MKTGLALSALGIALAVTVFLISRTASEIKDGPCRQLETQHGNYSSDQMRDADLDISHCAKTGRRTVIRIHGYDDGCEVAEIRDERPFEAHWTAPRQLTVRLGQSQDYRRIADSCGDVLVKFAALGSK